MEDVSVKRGYSNIGRNKLDRHDEKICHNFDSVLLLWSELSICIRNMGIWFYIPLFFFVFGFFVEIRKVHMGCVYKKVRNFI